MAKAAKKPGTAVMNVEAQMEAQAKQIAERIKAPSGTWIKCKKDKTFEFPNGDVAKELNVVIVQFAYRNAWYDRPFSEKDVTPPACFAISMNPKAMIPSDASPVKQAAACDGCPQNEFDSHPNGRGGKACGNNVILALASPGGDSESPLLYLKSSPTSLKSFGAYVSTVAKMYKKTPIGVITKITFDELADYQSLRFSDARPNPEVGKHWSRIGEAETVLLADFDVAAFKPAARGKGKGKR